jgi:hypothetical protein
MLTQFKEAVSVLTPSKTENVPAPVTGADSRGSLIVITPNPKDPPMLPIRPESGPEEISKSKPMEGAKVESVKEKLLPAN